MKILKKVSTSSSCDLPITSFFLSFFFLSFFLSLCLVVLSLPLLLFVSLLLSLSVLVFTQSLCLLIPLIISHSFLRHFMLKQTSVASIIIILKFIYFLQLFVSPHFSALYCICLYLCLPNLSLLCFLFLFYARCCR